MDFELSEEQKMFREAIRNFAENEVAPLVEEAERKEEFPVQLFPRMAELGYICVSYPPEYGGAGMGKLEECLEWEELSRVSLGINSGIMISIPYIIANWFLTAPKSGFQSFSTAC